MFLLEICTIVSLVYWGFHNHRSIILSYLLGIGTPLLAAGIWSVLAAPLSAHRLPMPYREIFSIIFFWGSAILLYQSGVKIYAIVFMIISLLSVIVASCLET
ncbi:YrdB family protein [Mucilaginibacter lappiensis]|uniref:YrdB family protein n=1 Tax=Mucilaginibacter lappiensis TaxID=354630 RepID=UPI00373FC83E